MFIGLEKDRVNLNEGIEKPRKPIRQQGIIGKHGATTVHFYYWPIV